MYVNATHFHPITKDIRMNISFPPARPLVIDCDGVLLDYLVGFKPFAEDRLGVELSPAGPENFELSGWLGCDTATTMQLVSDFNMGKGGSFASLPAFPGSVEALHAARATGRRLSIITACFDTPEVVALRRANLLDVFGDIFDRIDFVNPGTSKRAILEHYKGVAWIEDNRKNALLGAEIGHDTYLIRTSHNVRHEALSQHPRMTWVDGWSCIRRNESF